MTGPRIVIIADDLSGAADSAIHCAERGLETLVLFGDAHAQGSEAVIAIDADTRGCDPDRAAAISRALTRRFAGEGRLLFRKVDSTLRGHVAAELAATLAARRAVRPDVCVAFAPAFPATGRTVRDGRAFVHGVPLEDTPIWQLEGRAGPADLRVILQSAGLRVAVIDLATVRAADFAARLAALHAAGGIDVMAFDAECDGDLRATARAIAGSLLGEVIWAGSAGLARHLPHDDGPHDDGPHDDGPHDDGPRDVMPPGIGPLDGPVLFVIGSASTVSRRQADVLLAAGDLCHVGVPPSVLRDGAAGAGWDAARGRIAAGLASGRDTVVSLGADGAIDLGEGWALAAALATLVGEPAAGIGALVATGGETARAVLTAMGATGLRLQGEIEPGVPLSLAVGPRPIPVVTKAGAFGTDTTLRDVRARLRGVPPSTSREHCT